MVREEIAQRPQDILLDFMVCGLGKEKVTNLLKKAVKQDSVDNISIICQHDAGKGFDTFLRLTLYICNYFSNGADRANSRDIAFIIVAKIIDAHNHPCLNVTFLAFKSNITDVACLLQVKNTQFSRLAKFAHDSNYVQQKIPIHEVMAL